ncbi:MAG TPA: isoprenylcysteine carboxylmethyltransferase family protein [Thermoplasmatales archaeon]|nr:isoprenylcysteine carboxylmethyltransferase family protein [Thermoplasmatales archaeon]
MKRIDLMYFCLFFRSSCIFTAITAAKQTILLKICYCRALTITKYRFKNGKSVSAIPGGKAENKLISTGIYSLVRHPIYLGNILWFLGISLILRAKYALIYVPIFIILSMILTLAEENGLIEDFGGEYKEYKKKTRWRLFPYLF